MFLSFQKLRWCKRPRLYPFVKNEAQAWTLAPSLHYSAKNASNSALFGNADIAPF
ncbi:TPA: hypothetical protein PW676_001931, partial [Mannheimia haemolytica]|nr:hypothetical protein [Mannheimia haemolytica]